MERPSISFCGETNFYRGQKVKRINVINNSGQLLWDMGLDEQGKIIYQGEQGKNYYIKTYPQESNGGLHKKVVHYCEDDLIERLDTIVSGVVQLDNEDTLMYYRYYSIKSYKLDR